MPQAKQAELCGRHEGVRPLAHPGSAIGRLLPLLGRHHVRLRRVGRVLRVAGRQPLPQLRAGRADRGPRRAAHVEADGHGRTEGGVDRLARARRSLLLRVPLPALGGGRHLLVAHRLRDPGQAVRHRGLHVQLRHDGRDLPHQGAAHHVRARRHLRTTRIIPVASDASASCDHGLPAAAGVRRRVLRLRRPRPQLPGDGARPAARLRRGGRGHRQDTEATKANAGHPGRRRVHQPRVKCSAQPVACATGATRESQSKRGTESHR